MPAFECVSTRDGCPDRTVDATDRTAAADAETLRGDIAARDREVARLRDEVMELARANVSLGMGLMDRMDRMGAVDEVEGDAPKARASDLREIAALEASVGEKEREVAWLRTIVAGTLGAFMQMAKERP